MRTCMIGSYWAGAKLTVPTHTAIDGSANNYTVVKSHQQQSGHGANATDLEFIVSYVSST